MPDFVLSVRAVRKGAFTHDVGAPRYLLIPDQAIPDPDRDSMPASRWYDAVRKEAAWENLERHDRGDILFVVHGYNMSVGEVMQRHRRLKDDLAALGFKGVVVSYDWPSDDKALAYLADRHRAKQTAMTLVSSGIQYLSQNQTPDCTINIHLLGHSTGAYVIREAFDDADDTSLPNAGWSVSQVIFAAGDVSSASMAADDGGAASIYRHCVRLTNYNSRHDQALDLSNVKRAGTAPRVGRIGLPATAPGKAVNVDCSAHAAALESPSPEHPTKIVGMPTHSWYFGDLVFTRDLFSVLIGQDRQVIDTRDVAADGTLSLKVKLP